MLHTKFFVADVNCRFVAKSVISIFEHLKFHRNSFSFSHYYCYWLSQQKTGQVLLVIFFCVCLCHSFHFFYLLIFTPFLFSYTSILWTFTRYMCDIKGMTRCFVRYLSFANEYMTQINFYDTIIGQLDHSMRIAQRWIDMKSISKYLWSLAAHIIHSPRNTYQWWQSFHTNVVNNE